MNASRMRPENHWRGVGAAVAKSGGSLTDLDRVLTGKSLIDGWIADGYGKENRRQATRAIKLAKETE